MTKHVLTIISATLFAIALVGCNELNDSRDGKIYRTVKIGEHVWMAENLNYKTENSYCYGDNPSNCKKYGRLYTWDAASDACPAGWHLPSKAEFESLFKAVVYGQQAPGVKLKSKTGWNSLGNGSDSFGFAALPAGLRHDDGEYTDEGAITFFWTSTIGWGDDEYGDCATLYYNDDRGDYNRSFRKNYGFSVRCVQDWE